MTRRLAALWSASARSGQALELVPFMLFEALLGAGTPSREQAQAAQADQDIWPYHCCLFFEMGGVCFGHCGRHGGDLSARTSG